MSKLDTLKLPPQKKIDQPFFFSPSTFSLFCLKDPKRFEFLKLNPYYDAQKYPPSLSQFFNPVISFFEIKNEDQNLSSIHLFLKWIFRFRINISKHIYMFLGFGSVISLFRNPFGYLP
jgi:hypothetical protein